MANEVDVAVTGRDAGAKAALTGGAQAADQLGNRMKQAGDVARGVLAAGFIQDIGRRAAQFLGQAASAASGLEQAVGGTKAVFGDASAVVDDFGKKSAQAVGLSEREFREATTLIGGQLKRMTGDVDLAADSSIQLVKVGADLAATYGGTTKEAVDAFAAALRGEADPAERFNLNLKVSAVNAKAVELGLAQTTNEVDDNARAQALLALVMEQSADAQGQFAREADTAAVSAQKASAQWENAQATLGQTLLPLMAKAAGVVSTLAEGFGSLPGPVQAVTSAAVLLGAGLLVVLPRIAAAKVALAEMGVTARLSGTRVGGFAAAAGKAAGVLGGLLIAVQAIGAAVGSELNPQLNALTKGLAEFGRSGKVSGEAARILDDDLSGLRESLKTLGTGGFFGGFARGVGTILDPAIQNLEGSVSRSKETLNALDQALTQLVQSGRTEDAAAAFERIAQMADKAGVSQDKLRSLFPAYFAALETGTEATEEQADAHEDAAAATDSHVDSLKALAEELRAQTDPMFAFTKAQRDLEDAQKAVTKAERVHGEQSPQYRDALRGEAEAAIAVVDAAGELGDEFTGRLSRAQRQMLRDAGISEAGIERLAADLRRAKRDANRLDGTRVRVTRQEILHTIFRTTGRPPQGGGHFAHGGIVGGEQPTQTAQTGGIRGNDVLVGEQGPEIVELPFGTRVIPSGMSRSQFYSREEFTDREWRALMSGGVAAYMRMWDASFGDRASAALREQERQRVMNTLALLRDRVDELERRPSEPLRRDSETITTTADGVVKVELIIRGDGSQRAERIVDDVREGLRVNATFRREVAEVVRR